VIFFSDGVEKYIRLKKVNHHILFIIRRITILYAKKERYQYRGTLRFFNNANKKRSIMFLLSDSFPVIYQDALNIAAKRHDVVGVQVYDPRDKDLPSVGMMKMADSETGATQWVDFQR